MKKTLSVLLALVMTICMLTTTAMVASAAETDTQSGIEATLVTDKDAYSSGEDIKVTVNVKNTNTYDVNDVSITVELPEGLTLKSGDLSISDVDIAAGETYSKEVIAVKETSTPPTDNPTDTPTDKPTDKPADTPTDKPSTGNPNTGNNGNGNATSPQTGDSSNVLLWVALMAISAAGIFFTVKFRKKATKILSLFLCVVMVSAIVPTEAFAAESDTDTVSIAVDKTITVDGDEYVLKSNINLSNSQEEISLSNFEADDHYFIADIDNSITFTVDAVNIKEDVNLCNSSNEVLGKMHDDGLNGDVTADDGTYTFVLIANYHEGTIEFFAQSNDLISNTELVEFFNRPTENMRNDAKEIQENLSNITQKYSNERGEISLDDLNMAISEAIEYAKTLVNEQKVNDYEVTENSVVLNLPSGLTLLFSPRIEGTYSGETDNSMTIYTFQPLYDWVAELNDHYINLPSSVNNEAELIPEAADAVSSEFSNCSYSTATATRNQEISFTDIKEIGSNQIVLWQGHGDWAGEKIHSVLLTNGEFDWDAWLWNPVYFIDCCAKRIVNDNGWESVSSGYIDHYCNNMNNTYIYLGPCESGHDSTLAQSFLNKGASAVIGNTHRVLCLYGDMMEYTTTKLLAEINPYTGNYYNLGEALYHAKLLYGTNDSAYGGAGAEPTLFGGTNAQNYRLANIQTGTLSGKICKASDRSTAISGATINVYKNNSLYTTQTADTTGNYSINLPAGQYYIEITAEGYIDFHSYATVTEGDNTYMETFLMVEGSEDETGVASGRVVNSLTGTGIDSVTLTVRKDWNNLNESAETVATTTTGSNGNYSMELPLGNYTVVASKDGYITSSFNIIVQSGTTDNQNGTIVPVVSGDEFLITLTWGENPRDLDSHVEGTLTNGDPFHVYYGYKSQYDGDVEVCNLDYDDTDSYGPEHITLKVTTNEPYYYYIYKFAGSGTVAESRAKITVHQGNALIAEYNVPTNLGGDDYWNVFAIKDGQLIDKNTITSSADTSYAD